MSAAEKMHESLLTREEVEKRVGLSRSTIYARMTAGTFPLGRREPETGNVRWLESEIDAWLRSPSSHTAPVEPVQQCNHPRRDEPTCLYRHWSVAGELLYVGISLSSLDRLAGHRSGSPWFREIARIDIEWHDDRVAAMRAERRAIQTEGPKYNQMMVA